MNFESLAQLVLPKIKRKLESNPGLFIFAKERAKFEGWLKVELCNCLSKYLKDEIVPEKDRFDITFSNWAIELKTVNTNYICENVKKKTRPITKNIEGVIKDIKKLRKSDYENKAVLFIVFPLPKNKKHWQIHLKNISKHLESIKEKSFNFKNKNGKPIPGVIYFGLVKNKTSRA